MEFIPYDPLIETTSEFIDRSELFIAKLNKKKYSIILNFMNELICVEFKTLLYFKNIEESKLLNESTRADEIFKKYYEKLSKICDVRLKNTKTKLDKCYVVDDTKHKDEIEKNKEIIFFIERILKKIGYHMQNRIIDTKKYYTIKQIT